MRIGVQTWGTEGDVRPFFSLATGLVARGHEVRLVYTNVEGRTFDALATGCGVDARSVGAEYFLANKETLGPKMEAVMADPQPLRQIRAIIEHTMDPVVDAMFDAADDLAAWSDGMVGHFMTHPAGAAAAKHGRPYALVSLAPVLPSRHYAPIGTPDLGRLMNPVFWKILGFVLESVLRARVNRTRARAGIPPVENLLANTMQHAALALTAVSPTIFARPIDWDRRIHVSGFLGIGETAEPWEPEAGLRRFLDAGPPPAFLSFGSMMNLGGDKTEEAVRAFVAALKLAGARGIVQAPPSATADLTSDDVAHFIVRAPHSQLFPRCSVIVHHGGAGTTQSALLAGRPSIVVPHVADQFFWGDRLHARGVGAKPLPRTKLSAERLAVRLRTTLDDAAMAARSAEVGAANQREDGAATAAALVEEAFAAPQARSPGVTK